ncbi:MAG: MBL fold metallo-hydrolase [Bacteroidales bacterium]|nr:MBL fold metallo-hydrolase [Bacteroidales bacterium]MBN2698508.1 MBL fold metallo-hydrolase [Bacteroidales bacterium]
MKITVLTDNCAGDRLLAEHGLSYYIEHNGTKLLFDTGHSDLFLRNAEQLKINLREQLELVVLSHGHWDHGDGLRYLDHKTLVSHPDAFMKRYRKKDHSYVGLSMSQSEIENKFTLITSEKPYYLSDEIIFLGHVPRVNDFESLATSFITEEGTDDFIPDDSGLAIIHQEELIVLSGCAHAGICNTIEHARKVTGINRIKAVLGGFHLKNMDRITEKTISYLKENNIPSVYPSHCTELPALAAFYNAFRTSQVKTGSVLIF